MSVAYFRWGTRLVKVVDGRVLIDREGTASPGLARAPKAVRENIKQVFGGAAAEASESAATVPAPDQGEGDEATDEG